MHRSFASTKASALMAASLLIAMLGAIALPTVAQDAEEFPLPGSEEPIQGFTRSDGTVVLTDRAFCRFLLASLWGADQLTFAALIDKTKKQRPARDAAFTPADDEATITRCTDVLTAFRTDAPAGDTLAAWARRSPVVPESLAGLLPDDFVARPLAQPDPVLDAARTSGFGSLISAPFAMETATWLVEVDAAACPEWSGSLRDARDASVVIEVSDNREYLYGVMPGHYYWDVTASDCDWSVDLAPVELGPDPNATPVPQVAVPQLHGSTWSTNVGAPNEEYLTATQARQALLDAGLTVGECVEESNGFIAAGRVWGQEPQAGTLLDQGSPVDVFAVSDCDVVRGERIVQ